MCSKVQINTYAVASTSTSTSTIEWYYAKATLISLVGVWLSTWFSCIGRAAQGAPPSSAVYTTL